jgi:hypothetical protein
MILAMMDEGVMSPAAIAEMCLAYMSEDDVKDMCRANDILDEEDEDRIVEEEYDDSFPLSLEYDEGE